MTSPWAKIDKPVPVKLEDIMSEEVARDLQAKEDQKGLINLKEPLAEAEATSDLPPEVLEAIKNENTPFDNDVMIAQMLQMQYDKEYDHMLKKTEEKYNGTSKVSISFDNYRRAPQNYDFESESDEEEIEDSKENQFNPVVIPPCGYKMHEGKMITKHDSVQNGRKNACKLLSFPPEFPTGDGEGFDLKLSNKVFNSLRVHSKHEQVKRYKIRDKREDQATADFGMDEYARLLLYKMINKKLLQSVNGVISIGKEAVILHADSDPSFTECELPKECAIKLYKTTLSEFKQRDKYIKDDYRFKGRIGKQTARKTVHLWAEKEMANLMRLKRAKIPCPTVVTLKKHVLVMSFIGDDHKPAPKLKEAQLSYEDLVVAFDEVTEAMKTMYRDANLIHADLSEYNILWYNKKCYFIDVSQSVEPSHENSFTFLMRDCKNVINFFTRKGLPELPTAEDLFLSITGYDFDDRLALASVQETFKMKPHLVDKPGLDFADNFDTAWEKSQAGEVFQVTSRVLSEVDHVVLVESPKA